MPANTTQPKANCGIGGIAYMNATTPADHDIIRALEEELICADTRGGVSPSSDGNAIGDGAGVLTDIPDKFLRKWYDEHQGTQLPPQGEYGVGHFFLPENKKNSKEIHTASAKVISNTLYKNNLRILGWREVPINKDVISKDAQESMPKIWQAIVIPIDRELFTENGTFIPKKFNRCLKRADLELEKKGEDVNKEYNKIIEEAPTAPYASKQPRRKKEGTARYTVTSLSNESIIYKGLLRASQTIPFFLDLQDPDYESKRAMYHVRFATNAGSTWEDAHPKRNFSHNGEINTILANVRRHQELHDQVYEMKERMINPFGSDTQELDRANSVLQVEQGVSLPTAILMQMPPVVAVSEDPEEENKRLFFQYIDQAYKPAAGPAHIAFTDSDYFGAYRDPGGFRPSNITIYTDPQDRQVFRMGSESIVTERHIKPGTEIQRYTPKRGGLFALQKQAHGSFVPITTEVAIRQAMDECQFDPDTYRQRKISLPTEASEPTIVEYPDGLRLAQVRMIGYQDAVDDRALDHMARTGKVEIVAMGDDRNLAALSNRPRRIADFFKQRFVMVTAPALDPVREEIATSMETLLGANPLKIKGARFIELPSPILKYGDDQKIKTAPDIESATLDATMEITEGGLNRALERLCAEAIEQVRSGKHILFISDRGINKEKAPIPDMLAIAAVNNALKSEGLSLNTSIVAESCSVSDAHHAAMLLACGANAVCPYLAYETMIAKKVTAPNTYPELTAENLCDNINKGLVYGLKFVLSRMGFNRASSYVDAMGSVIESTGIRTDNHGTPSSNPFELSSLFGSVAQNLGIYTLDHFELMTRWQHSRAVGYEDLEFVLPNDRKTDKTGFSQEWAQAFRKMIHENQLSNAEQENHRQQQLRAAINAKSISTQTIPQEGQAVLSRLAFNVQEILDRVLSEKPAYCKHQYIVRELLSELQHFHEPGLEDITVPFIQFLEQNSASLEEVLAEDEATVIRAYKALFENLSDHFTFNKQPTSSKAFKRREFEEQHQAQLDILGKESTIARYTSTEQQEIKEKQERITEKIERDEPDDEPNLAVGHDRIKRGYNAYLDSVITYSNKELGSTPPYYKRHRETHSSFEHLLEHLDEIELGKLNEPERRLYHSLPIKGREAAFSRAFFGRQILHRMETTPVYKEVLSTVLQTYPQYREWLIEQNFIAGERTEDVETSNPFIDLQFQDSPACALMGEYLHAKKQGKIPGVDIGIMDGRNNRLLKIGGRYSKEQIDAHTTPTAGFQKYNKTTEDAEQEIKPLPHHLLHLEANNEYTLPISAVEPMSEMVQHFTSGAMSYGSVKWLAHGDIAEAHNAVGTDGSNDGEGGHPTNDLNRSGRNKQWASGRFGTGHMMVEVVQCLNGMMQIKIAQGAKPGEGGELPDNKVDPEIAFSRSSIPGIGLISPPPHHDIYSIEDLKTLIIELRKAGAKVSVKLCATAAIKPIIAGVIKCGAHSVSIPCGSGGTGAAKHFSQTSAGITGIIGLLYAKKSIEDNNLETQLFTSGSFKTIKDLVLALALADVETGTIQLGASGCVAIDECFKAAQVEPGNVESGGCSVGITNTAWNYEGQVEDIERLALDFASGVRQELARLGYKNIKELRSDFLAGKIRIIPEQLDKLAAPEIREMQLDYDYEELRELLSFKYDPEREKPKLEFVELDPDHDTDWKLAEKIATEIHTGTTEYLESTSTKDVAFGASFTRLHPNGKSLYDILKENNQTVKITTVGQAKAMEEHEFYLSPAGQRYGAMLGDRIHLHHIGFFHDYVGGSQMGGTISVTPPISQRTAAEQNTIAGNSCLYGVTGGKAYFNGGVGDRFGIRKSGGVSIVTGETGDFALEYMTNGEAYFLGPVGAGFGAGMTGGLAVLYNDETNKAIEDRRYVIKLEPQEMEPYLDIVKRHIEECAQITGSTACRDIIQDWEHNKDKLTLVIPKGMRAIEEGLRQGQNLATCQHKAAMIIEAYGSDERRQKLSPMMQIWVARLKELLEHSKVIYGHGDDRGDDDRRGPGGGDDDKRGPGGDDDHRPEGHDHQQGPPGGPANDNQPYNKHFSWQDINETFTKQHQYNSVKATIHAVYEDQTVESSTPLRIESHEQNLALVIADILSRTSCSCGAATCGSCSLERDTQQGARLGGTGLDALLKRIQPVTITPAIDKWIDSVIPYNKRTNREERHYYAAGYFMAQAIYTGTLHPWELDYLKAAYSKYAQSSPLMFTSRVCPAACESSCTKVNGPGAVPVKGIEYVVHEVAEAYDLWKKYIHRPEQELNEKIAIVGSGPAGLEAALKARLAGYKVVIYERKPIDEFGGTNAAGGLARDGIPNDKGVDILANLYYERLVDIGVEFRFDHSPDKEELGQYNGVILATGVTDEPRYLPGNITLNSQDHSGVFKKHQELLEDARTIEHEQRYEVTLPLEEAIKKQYVTGFIQAMDLLPAFNKQARASQLKKEDPGNIYADLLYNKDIIQIGAGDTGADVLHSMKLLDNDSRAPHLITILKRDIHLDTRESKIGMGFPEPREVQDPSWNSKKKALGDKVIEHDQVRIKSGSYQFDPDGKLVAITIEKLKVPEERMWLTKTSRPSSPTPETEERKIDFIVQAMGFIGPCHEYYDKLGIAMRIGSVANVRNHTTTQPFVVLAGDVDPDSLNPKEGRASHETRPHSWTVMGAQNSAIHAFKALHNIITQHKQKHDELPLAFNAQQQQQWNEMRRRSDRPLEIFYEDEEQKGAAASVTETGSRMW